MARNNPFDTVLPDEKKTKEKKTKLEILPKSNPGTIYNLIFSDNKPKKSGKNP